MAKFAVVDTNNIVVNIIECVDSLVAQELTGLQCLEFTNEIVHIGGKFNSSNNTFLTPSPYPSWIFLNNSWNPPVAKPTDAIDGRTYNWDEDTKSWKEGAPLGCTWYPEIKNYAPPTLPPTNDKKYAWVGHYQRWVTIEEFNEPLIEAGEKPAEGFQISDSDFAYLKSILPTAEFVDLQTIERNPATINVNGPEGL